MDTASFGNGFSNLFVRAFPTPEFLAPLAAGVDISDGSVKWIILKREALETRVISYGEIDLPRNIVSHGAVKDAEALAHALSQAKALWGHVRCAHAALPEEAAYAFSMHVPAGTAHDQVLRLIEFELEDRVPIPPSAAVYDYDVITDRNVNELTEIGIVAFPRDLAHQYADVFAAAGIQLLSLELEARSVGRAITYKSDPAAVTLLVDFGRARTGIAILNRGVPIFTSTLEVGGDAVTRAVMEQMRLSPEEAEIFKNEQGLSAHTSEAVIGPASALADEVGHYYQYWDTRRDEHGERMTPVGRVLLVGGSANLNGLAEYIASRIQAPTEQADVWRHVFSFDTVIPPIDKRTSLEYATAIGLALRAF